MKVSYLAYDKSGARADGSIEASSVSAATEQLRKQGIFVTQARAGSGPALAPVDRPASSRGYVSGGERLRCVAMLMRQSSVLIATGTPVVEALLVQERQIKPGRWRTAVEDVRKRVEEGAQLSEAMASHPEYFDAVCRALIAAGESRGKLGEMLQRLATLLRQQLKVRSAVIGAMVYPCLLIVVAVSVVGLMMGFVLPRFEGLFQSLNAPLPPATQLLMVVSGWMRQWWWALFGSLAILGLSIKVWLASEQGRLALDVMAVRVPPFGRIVRSLATARIARVLGVLMEGKVSLLDALALTRQATPNTLYAQLVANAEAAVTRGEPVSSAFSDATLINSSVCEALRAGERTGQVGPVLLTLADFMDEDNEVVVKSITSILEPMILVILGAIVAFVAISMFMPLFDLAGSGMGGGGGGGAQ